MNHSKQSSQARPGEMLEPARQRARELREFWAEKGYNIVVSLVPVEGLCTDTRKRRFVLRSNLVNGCPPGYLADMARKAKIAARLKRDERAW